MKVWTLLINICHLSMNTICREIKTFHFVFLRIHRSYFLGIHRFSPFGEIRRRNISRHFCRFKIQHGALTVDNSKSNCNIFSRKFITESWFCVFKRKLEYNKTFVEKKSVVSDLFDVLEAKNNWVNVSKLWFNSFVLVVAW